MINEGIFRSPKWLRNFLDFEVNTGDDIKGEPSKRAIAKEEKRKKEESLKRWDIAWENAKKERTFEQFLNGKIGRPSYSTIWTSDFRDLKAKFRGDHGLFTQYKAYLDEKRAEEKRQEDLRQEIVDIIYSIERDFNRAPWRDKIKGYTNRSGEFCIKFTFENGNYIDIFDINGRKFKYSDGKTINTYSTSLSLFNDLITIVNRISSKMKDRPKSSGSSSGSGSYDRYRDTYDSRTKTKSDNPKRDKYDTLLNTIKLREEQLRKMPKNDDQRAALENELAAVKRMAKKLKDEHKFENLKGFNDFDNYN